MIKKIKGEMRYCIDDLVATGATYLIVVSERTNGKSYQAKEKSIKDFFAGKGQVGLVRRYEIETKKDFTNSYFDDMGDVIIRESDGEYDCVIRYGASLYFAKIDDEGKTKRGAMFGRILWLTGATTFKGNSLRKIKTIIFEEFITPDGYLDDEAGKLMSIVSTIARERLDLTVIMLGNTVSRLCPYFYEWDLKNVMRQKPGTIDIYTLEYEGDRVKIAVERPEVIKRRSILIGKARSMTVNGEWEVRKTCVKPHADSLYSIYVLMFDMTYCLDLVRYANDGYMVRVRPHVGKINRETTRRVDLRPDYDLNGVLTSHVLTPMTTGDKAIIKCIKDGRICYSDALTGTEFEAVLKKL